MWFFATFLVMSRVETTQVQILKRCLSYAPVTHRSVLSGFKKEEEKQKTKKQ